jgi:hypothetical protein
MTDKYTLRDLMVYILLGFTALFFCFLRFPFEVMNTISDSKDYSDLTILLLIPFCYLIGHLVMSLDDIVFNGFLARFFPKDNPLKNKCWKFYNFVFFGYRNIGIRNKEKISNQEFLKACDKLILEGKYEKAEYYQIMSDLFKGIVFIIILSFVVDAYYHKLELWKFFILVPIWYRARVFSAYYVRMIIRNINILHPTP